MRVTSWFRHRGRGEGLNQKPRLEKRKRERKEDGMGNVDRRGSQRRIEGERGGRWWVGQQFN